MVIVALAAVVIVCRIPIRSSSCCHAGAGVLHPGDEPGPSCWATPASLPRQAAYLGVGAYATAILATKYNFGLGWDFWLCC